jgi:DNA-binding LytR/AlgR family response regulator
MIKIGIVEDEAIIADDLAALLEEMGYTCPEPAANYEDALAMLQRFDPDIAIVDINLAGRPDGLKVARYINEKLKKPFIFLTANSDPETVTSAREFRPAAYLVKPFQKADIYTAIEIALYNFQIDQKDQDAPQLTKLITDSLFVRDGDFFTKVRFDDIVYLSSEHVYVTIHTQSKKYLVRSTMQDYLLNFDPEQFLRVHRSYVVNLKWIERINTQSITAGGFDIPVSRQLRDDLLRRLKLG